MKALLARLLFWRRRRDDLTWDEIVEFLAGPEREQQKLTFADLAAHLGTHLGTCSWSQMRSGRVWAFYAEAVEVKL